MHAFVLYLGRKNQCSQLTVRGIRAWGTLGLSSTLTKQNFSEPPPPTAHL